MFKDNPHPNFWASQEVVESMTQAMRLLNPRWQISPGAEPWRALGDEIVRLNTRGAYTRAIGPGPHSIDEVPFPRDDGAATYLPFRNVLFVLADLLALFRKHVEGMFGPGSWETSEGTFKGDSQGWTFFKLLRELSAIDRPAAVDCLEQISRKGVSFKRPGGLVQRYRCRDRGIEPLVNTSLKLISYLQAVQKGSPALREVSGTAPDNRKRIVIDSHGDSIVELRHQGKTVELTRNPRQFFIILFRSQQQPVLYKDIWDVLYHKKPYVPNRKGGPPPRLRRLKCDVNGALEAEFGRPPGARFWIERVPGQGYRLDRSSVIWQLAKGAADRFPHILLDPAFLDKRSRDD